MRLLPGLRDQVQPVHLVVPDPALIVLEALAARPRHPGGRQLVMRAAVAEELLRQRLLHHFQALGEHRPRAFRTARVRVGVEGHHLVGLARAPETDLQPPLQQLVEQRDVLRHPQGVPERQHHHRGAQTEARGAAAEIRATRKGLGRLSLPLAPKWCSASQKASNPSLIAERRLLAQIVEQAIVAEREVRVLERAVEDESHGRSSRAGFVRGIPECGAGRADPPCLAGPGAPSARPSAEAADLSSRNIVFRHAERRARVSLLVPAPRDGRAPGSATAPLLPGRRRRFVAEPLPLCCAHFSGRGTRDALGAPSPIVHRRSFASRSAAWRFRRSCRPPVGPITGRTGRRRGGSRVRASAGRG